MADLIIPTSPGVPSYRQRTILEGVEYTLAFRWAARELRWYLDITDSLGVLIIGSIKLVANFPLLASRRVDERVPPGELFVIDTGDVPADPGLDDLGADSTMIYRESTP